ncbi:thioredoxin [uncultured Fibrella sp.]|uniref:thioredoxin n=1 Tax=uncultured Fibrella sp. TaxID=1284596 RepID=UPI0035CA0D5F
MNKANQQLPFSDLIKSGEPVLVEFFATWCAPCKALAPTLKHLSDRTGDKLKIVKVDIDRARPVATKFQIQSVPTMILFKDGKVVWRMSGVQSIGKLEAAVKPHLG